MFNFNKVQTIYVSHIRQEIEVAEEIKLELEARGYQAVLTPHERSERQLKNLCPRIIQEVDAVIILTSPSATRSERVWADMAHARFNNLPVIPMVVHHFDEKIPMHNHINATDSLEFGLKELDLALSKKNRYKKTEIHYTPIKSFLRKTVVAAAILVLSLFSMLLG